MPKEVEPDDKLEVTALVKDLALLLQSRAQPKVHPILYVNLALVLGIAFSSGVLYQRVGTLEARTTDTEHKLAVVQSSETLSVEVNNLRTEVYRLRDRIDKFLDRNTSGR